MMLVDFSDYKENNTKEEINYRDPNTGKIIEYDERTTEFYKKSRNMNIDIITYDDINKEEAFVYPYMWDAYTGEKILYNDKPLLDPFGSLCFHPDNLIIYFYKKRLAGLWVPDVDEGENGGYYDGYYGEFLGSGFDMEIIGRGIYKERYLFRLPICDCYLDKNHGMSIITMGPILTNDELKNIEYLANAHFQSNFFDLYQFDRPSLLEIKKWYDQAISKNPDMKLYNKTINKMKKIGLHYEKYDASKIYNNEELAILKTRANMQAVEVLKNL